MTDKYLINWQTARAAAEAAGLRIIEHGWEQHVIIDEKAGIVYRYPRHDAAAAKLADEVAVLNDVNKHAWPIALPVMREHNDTFTAYKYIPGEVLIPERVEQAPAESLEKIGARLGHFLARFHHLDFQVVTQKKTKHHTSLLQYYEGRINSSIATDFYDKALLALNKLKGMMDEIEPVVLHGDLHGPNVVVDPKTFELQGVIDLSEMETGDPHQEFRKIFMTFPRALNSAVEAYQKNGGHALRIEKIIQWAFVNEWANAGYFADEPENVTFKRAVQHLQKWGQL